MTKIINAGILVAMVIAIIAFGGCKDSLTNSSGYQNNPTPPSKTPPPNTITISGFAFSPSSLTITKGTIVTFKNNDGVIHTATSNDGSWNTGDIGSGGSKTITFSNAGVFGYYCARHTSMKGTITVQ